MEIAAKTRKRRKTKVLRFLRFFAPFRGYSSAQFLGLRNTS
jgi:hypothetical protein